MVAVNKDNLIRSAVRGSSDHWTLGFFFVFLIWIFISFKPQWTIPGFKFIAPLETLFQLVVIFILLFAERKRLNNPTVRYYVLFFAVMVVSSIFARNNGLSRETIRAMFFLYASCTATIAFADNEKKIFLLFKVFVLGNLVIAVLGIIGGGLAKNVALFADQNEYALLMNILFPITVFLAVGEGRQIHKIFYLSMSAVFLAGVVISHSRGGFVGLSAVLIFMWLKLFKNKLKSGVIILCVILGLAIIAPASYWEEMSTLQQGTHESTAASRIYFWQIAIRQFIDHPLIGVGVNNYGVWLPDYAHRDDKLSDGRPVSGMTRAYGRVAHSMYFTILAELGILGSAFFAFLVYHFFKNSIHMAKTFNSVNPGKNATKANSDGSLLSWRSLNLGLTGGMIGYLVSGAFVSVLFFPYFWLMCALSATLKECSGNVIAGENNKG